METHSGRFFTPAHLKAGGVDFDDMVYALARLPRFGGHSPYPVALHCVGVARTLKLWEHPPVVQLHGLMHDAHEAYVQDIARPFFDGMPEAFRTAYKLAEERAARAVYQAFELPLPTEVEERFVKVADIACMIVEAIQYMPCKGQQFSFWTEELDEKARALRRETIILNLFALEYGETVRRYHEVVAATFERHYIRLREEMS
jgi:hypothetical protein